MSDHPPSGDRASDRSPSALAQRLLHPKAVAGLVIAVLAIWFSLANGAETRVHLWVFWVSARLWLVLLATFAAGFAAGRLLRRRTVRR
ncbi:MAG TPA: hypothetical protein VGX23_03940 [Actinocrinis sp.]|nr:hypothetical protein [Actinocrinis sp.]